MNRVEPQSRAANFLPASRQCMHWGLKKKIRILPDFSEIGGPFSAEMAAGAAVPCCIFALTEKEMAAKAHTPAKTRAAVRYPEETRDVAAARKAMASMSPSPRKKPGPTARLIQGKQLHSAPRSSA